MTWRLLVMVVTAVPSVTLTDWTASGGGQARELRFKAADGEHVVRFSLSKVQEKATGDSQSRSQELVVTHLLGSKEVFKAKDFVQACEFDLSLELLADTVRVTDLDEDGTPEVSFAYKLGCRSDVSPLTAKLLLYEGATKYALRGEASERVGETEYAGGDFKADPAFEKGPRAFLEFAQAQWKRYLRSP